MRDDIKFYKVEVAMCYGFKIRGENEVIPYIDRLRNDETKEYC